MTKFHYSKWKIERNSLCPCRSGKKYKKCCALNIDTDLKDKAYDYYKKGDYATAEIAFRVFLTQYISWYHEHTVPFYRQKPEKAEGLLIIDIQAVIEALNFIESCLYKQGKKAEIFPFLIRAEDIIDDRRYKGLVTLKRAAFLASEGNFNEIPELLRTVDIKDLLAISLLGGQSGMLAGLYIDFLWNELPITHALQITDNLLAQSSDAADKLHLSCKKALILFAHLDRETAAKLIDDALGEYKPTQEGDFLEAYSEANAYKMKFLIGHDKEHGIKAIRAHEKLFSFLKECPASTAWCEHQIGQIYFDMEDYEQALNHLELSHNIEPSSLSVKLDLAKTNAHLGAKTNALKFLGQIEKEEIDDNFKVDYLRILADIAIFEANHDAAREISSQLSELNLSIPIISEFRSSIRISLLEMLSMRKRPKGLLERFRESVSRYMILQPNFFGIGININEIIKPKKK